MRNGNRRMRKKRCRESQSGNRSGAEAIWSRAWSNSLAELGRRCYHRPPPLQWVAGCVVIRSFDRTLHLPFQAYSHATVFTLSLGGSKARNEPSGRADGGSIDVPTCPPRKLACARFRPSQREGEVIRRPGRTIDRRSSVSLLRRALTSAVPHDTPKQ